MTSRQLAGSPRRLESWIFDTADSRNALVGVGYDDIGRIGYEEETGTYWRLIQCFPTVVWEPVATGEPGPPGTPGASGPQGPVGPVGPLDILTDVTITSPTIGQVLRKSSGDWVNATLAFADLGNTPTTIAGYNITDAFTQATADTLYSVLAHVHTFASLISKPTTLGGYGITDAYTMDVSDSKYAPIVHTHPLRAIDASSFTTGSVLHVVGGAVAEDNANLFYDATNKRLGLGTISPGARLHILETNAATTGILPMLYIAHNSTAATAPMFGSLLGFKLRSTTQANIDAADISVDWAEATHTTRKGRITFNVWDATAAREGLRIEANVGVARLVFYGAGPAIGRQTVAAAGINSATTQALANDLRAKLIAVGLFA